jgi:hypothetical protein
MERHELQKWIEKHKGELTPYGMIDREGKFHPLPFIKHELYARLLNTTKDKLLNELGWIGVSGTIDVGKKILLPFKITPNQSQLDTLFDWAMENNYLAEYKEVLKRIDKDYEKM